jgi:hypothetical protein
MTSGEEQPKLELQTRCLAVFVDDTGHEALVKDQPFYGLGGCAALGRDFERLITQPWKEVRRVVKGSSDSRLHANKFGKKATTEDYEVVANFFRAPFWRFGAVLTTETTRPPEIDLMQMMKIVLQKRIDDIVQMTLCKHVSVVFESSQRADSLVQKTFQNFDFYRGTKRIPSECYFMPKAAGEPALEVADFVMHAVGRQVRHDLTRRGDFLADFCAVFHAVDQKFTSFMEVGGVIHKE